ncbi:MAG: hypothetical protein V1494_02450 [Candidatus Diapherotrites archaeon]
MGNRANIPKNRAAAKMPERFAGRRLVDKRTALGYKLTNAFLRRIYDPKIESFLAYHITVEPKPVAPKKIKNGINAIIQNRRGEQALGFFKTVNGVRVFIPVFTKPAGGNTFHKTIPYSNGAHINRRPVKDEKISTKFDQLGSATEEWIFNDQSGLSLYRFKAT